MAPPMPVAPPVTTAVWEAKRGVVVNIGPTDRALIRTFMLTLEFVLIKTYKYFGKS